MEDKPKWLTAFRDMLVRYGEGMLIYTERGPEGRKRLNKPPETNILIGTYTQQASDQQILEDAEVARDEARVRYRQIPKGLLR